MPSAARSGVVCLAIAAGACAPYPDTPLASSPQRPVTVLAEPDAGAAALLGLLASARQSLWMEMYLLTFADAIAAIEGRARAGCDVRVTLEPSPYDSPNANQSAYDRLAAAGASVRWSSPRFSFTHAKAFTVDHARLVAMTLNLTGSGLAGNREFAAVDDDPTDVAAAEAIFASDQAGGVAAPSGRLVTSPETSRSTLTSLVGSATRRLTLETEELTDPDLTRALVAARGRGVGVTVVWPGPATNPGSAFGTLVTAGVTVRALATPAIHAKTAVADGETIYLGSANLTPTSLDKNREIGLVLTDRAAAAEVESVVASDAARGTPPQ